MFLLFGSKLTKFKEIKKCCPEFKPPISDLGCIQGAKRCNGGVAWARPALSAIVATEAHQPALAQRASFMLFGSCRCQARRCQPLPAAAERGSYTQLQQLDGADADTPYTCTSRTASTRRVRRVRARVRQWPKSATKAARAAASLTLLCPSHPKSEIGGLTF